MTPLSFSLNIETLSSKPSEYHLTASVEERNKVAKRLNLLSIEKLEAHLRFQKKDMIYLRGTISAEVTQQCVRTLVPLPQSLEIPIDEIFTLIPPDSEKEIELETEDLAEPLSGNVLDVGEVVIQLLSLNLDPYPVSPETTPVEYQEEKTIPSPFDVLKKKK